MSEKRTRRLLRMGWILVAVLLCFSLVAFTACGGAPPGEQQEEEEEEEEEPQPITLVYTDPSAADGPRTKLVKWWGDELEKRTNGRIKVQYYWGGSLAKDVETLEAIKTGAADVGTIPGFTYTKQAFPRWFFAEQLLMVDDWYGHGKAVKAMYDSEATLRKEFTDYGVIPVALLPSVPVEFFSNFEWRTLEDVAGHKVNAIGAIATFLQPYGYVPVSMGLYDCYEGFSKGTIEAAQGPGYVLYAFKWYEVTDYLIRAPMMIFVPNMFMNLGTWNELSAAEQDIIEDLWEELLDKQTEVFDGMEQTIQSTATAQGVQIIHIESEEFERWKTRARETWSVYLNDMTALGVDGQALIDKYYGFYNTYKRW